MFCRSLNGLKWNKDALIFIQIVYIYVYKINISNPIRTKIFDRLIWVYPQLIHCKTNRRNWHVMMDTISQRVKHIRGAGAILHITVTHV